MAIDPRQRDMLDFSDIDQRSERMSLSVDIVEATEGGS